MLCEVDSNIIWKQFSLSHNEQIETKERGKLLIVRNATDVFLILCEAKQNSWINKNSVSCGAQKLVSKSKLNHHVCWNFYWLKECHQNYNFSYFLCFVMSFGICHKKLIPQILWCGVTFYIDWSERIKKIFIGKIPITYKTKSDLLGLKRRSCSNMNIFY